MRKPQIPAITSEDRALNAQLKAIKENIELLTGVRGGNIELLSSSATTDQIIVKLNEIIGRLNA